MKWLDRLMGWGGGRSVGAARSGGGGQAIQVLTRQGPQAAARQVAGQQVIRVLSKTQPRTRESGAEGRSR